MENASNPWDDFRTLLDPDDKDWLPDEMIPDVPGIYRAVAEGGELTWDIPSDIRFGDGKKVIPFQRKAVEGEYLRDVEMRFVMDMRENLLFRAQVKNNCESNAQAIEWQRRLCRNSIVYFINVWCWTFHPGRTPQPFIAFKKQQDIARWFVWLVKLRLSGLVEKSREGGVSWLMVLATLWLAIFFPNYWALHLSVTEAEVDNRTVKSLLGKLRFALNRLPDWMRAGWVENAIGVDLKMNIRFPDNDSVVQGELTGGQAGIGGRANVGIYDEFARVETSSDTLEASSSLAFTKIFVSTVKGMANDFARIAHDPATNKIRFHWSEHDFKFAGERDNIYESKWAIRERAKSEYTTEIWAQEQDINYATSTSGRVYQRFWSSPDIESGWCHIGRGYYADFEPGPDVEVFMDYGISKSNPNVVLFAQIKEALPKYRAYTDECLVIFDEMYAVDQMADELVDYLKQVQSERGYRYGRFIGDMYTGTQRDRTSRERRSIQTYFTSQGMNLVGNRHGDSIPILEVRKLHERPGAFLIHERCVYTILAQQNWSYPVDKLTKQPIPGAKPNHDQYSHPNKALSYGVDYIYGVSQGMEDDPDAPWDFRAYHKFGNLHQKQGAVNRRNFMTR